MPPVPLVDFPLHPPRLVSMPAYKFPVLLWQDAEGFYSARAVDWENQDAAIDVTAAGALRQVKRYLQGLYRENPWLAEPDFEDPHLLLVPVPVRPQYEAAGRRFPCDHAAELRVACVHGRQRGGLLVCSIPMLNLHFHYYEEESLRRLVAEHVKGYLGGVTPKELSRLFLPMETKLEKVLVSVPRRARNREQQERLPLLTSIAEALGRLKGEARAWERQREVHSLTQRLGKEGASVLLTGEAGVGKSTILAAAVRKLQREQKPEEELEGPSAPSRYWLTSAGRLVAGMKYLGQWEERCEGVIDELSEIGGVLCIENLLELVLQGGGGPEASLAAFFMPYLQNGELRMVVESTPAELEACRRQLPGFAELFQLQVIEPMSPSVARQALTQYAASECQKAQIEIEQSAVDTVCRLFHRFLPYRALPGGAAPFLSRLIDDARQFKEETIVAEHVVDHFVQHTGLPPRFVRDEIPLPLQTIEEALRKNVLGQEEACRTVAATVAAFKAGMNDPGRPLGVLLFAGPTGVGKTELARTLSQFLFGAGKRQDDRLLRLDMSEYGGYDAAGRLLSRPDGRPSDFIDRARAQPFCVVLLDEIEKAHHEVFDVLLGMFDEGRLTDELGRTTNFKSAVIIMTSNLGADARPSIGFDPHAAADFHGHVRKHFRPEFYNRLDEVVTFLPLGRDICRQVVELHLRQVAGREGILNRRLRLRFTDRLIDHLADSGFDPRYGARPLQRALEAEVVAPLSRMLVEQPQLGDCELCVDAAEGTVVIA